MEISNGQIKMDFAIGGNIRLINESYNSVRKEENAIAIEWMIKGEEALRDFFSRIGLRYNNLGKTLRERLESNLEDIQEDAENISSSPKKRGRVAFKTKPLKNKDVEVIVKWVRGRYDRPPFPSVNIVIPLSECTKRRSRYDWNLTFEEAIEIGYSTLYWISASEISEGKGLKTAEGILGRIE